MFTGIVETMGKIHERLPDGFTVEASFNGGPLALGESISVDGVCLTVSRIEPFGFHAQISQETFSRTTLGAIRAGQPVNLERALMPTSRLGGHIVTGHVDTVTQLLSRVPETNSERWTFSRPESIARYIAFKGSVTLDGVSLTVAGIQPDRFEIALIPHTLLVTTFAGKQPGSAFNLEIDILARYVESIVGLRNG